MSALVADFVTFALTQARYANPAPPRTAPPAAVQAAPTVADLDGGDLVAWAAAMVGAAAPSSVAELVTVIRATGLTVTVAAGKTRRGVLLFRAGQVGISLGDGRVIVPVGAQYAIDNVDSGAWTSAGQCPGVAYS